MGLFKQAEFAAKCGIQQAYLTMNRKRGKVVVGEDGMVDDQNILNATFLEKCLKRPKKEPKELVEAETTFKEKVEKPQKAQITEKKSKSDQYEKYDKQFDLTLKKKEMEIAKMERDSRLAEMQHEKSMGKLIPMDLVKNQFSQTFKAYTITFKQEAEKIIMEFAKRYKLNRNDAAEMREQLNAVINRAVEDGTAESRRSVMAIVREYSQSGSV